MGVGRDLANFGWRVKVHSEVLDSAPKLIISVETKHIWVQGWRVRGFTTCIAGIIFKIEEVPWSMGVFTIGCESLNKALDGPNLCLKWVFGLELTWGLDFKCEGLLLVDFDGFLVPNLRVSRRPAPLLLDSLYLWWTLPSAWSFVSHDWPPSIHSVATIFLKITDSTQPLTWLPLEHICLAP